MCWEEGRAITQELSAVSGDLGQAADQAKCSVWGWAPAEASWMRGDQTWSPWVAVPAGWAQTLQPGQASLGSARQEPKPVWCRLGLGAFAALRHPRPLLGGWNVAKARSPLYCAAHEAGVPRIPLYNEYPQETQALGDASYYILCAKAPPRGQL